MNLAKYLSLNCKSLPVIAVVLAAIFWVADAAIDVMFFEQDELFMESLLSPGLVELWMRLLVVCLLVGFSFYARSLLQSQIEVSKELRSYKAALENIVEERTSELRTKNELLKNEIVIRKDAEGKLELMAATDPLTLLYNRRKFNEILSHEIARNQRHKSGLSLIFFDIDHFKQVNDTYGHETGDRVLKQFSTIIKESIRDSDFFARWGGEEFVFLISGSEPGVANEIAEKTRKLIENTEFEVVGRITASFGIASLVNGEDEKTFITRADSALYKAKQNGRNLVIVSDD